MKKIISASWILLLACLLSACSPTNNNELADFAGLQEGWNAIEPGGETVCSDGTPYRFFVRPGDPEKFLFYLEGGGACWAGENCDPDIQPSYQVNLSRTDPNQAHGIFAFSQASNPFADYTVVMAPYCSGDVHLGDNEQVFQMPAFEGHQAHELRVRHRGLNNAQSALDWSYGHLFAPQTIFVTGSSAGSIPSPYYAVKLSEHYEDARIIQLGDASGGYRGFANFNPYDSWNTDEVIGELEYMQNIPGESFSFHQLYIAAHRANPDIRLASFDTVEDSVQKQFLALGGSPTRSLLPLLDANLEEISQEVDDFRYFVAGGDVHTILLRPELYTYKAGDVALLDWLSRLAAGELVDNARCVDCAVAETAD